MIIPILKLQSNIGMEKVPVPFLFSHPKFNYQIWPFILTFQGVHKGYSLISVENKKSDRVRLFWQKTFALEILVIIVIN